MSLSPDQEAVARWFADGVANGTRAQNVVVRARAGTGKTHTILAGIARAPETRAPYMTLLAAFNKAIASELQSKVSRLPCGTSRVHVKTLHSLGCRFVFANRCGATVDERGARARALARAAVKSGRAALVDAVAKLHTKAREITPFAAGPQDLQWLVTRFDINPPEGASVGEICEAAHRAMALARSSTGDVARTFDFADMIYLPLVENWVKRTYSLVVVDEAQDMTAAQLELAQRMAFANGRIVLVGDDRQAIYAFRGADAGGLDRMREELRATELPLRVTRRCARRVVEVARTIVPDIEAMDDAPAGVVRTVGKTLLSAQAAEGDFILSRTNGPLICVALDLLKRGKRARIRGKDIGRQAHALLQALDPADPSDIPALARGWAVIENDRAAALPADLQAERLDAINDQVAVLTDLSLGCRHVADVRDRIDLLFDDDVDVSVVTCASVHRAKGLEAERVFLLEGTFRKGEGEEANIRYVAITRAKTELVWVTGFERARDGGAAPAEDDHLRGGADEGETPRGGMPSTAEIRALRVRAAVERGRGRRGA